VIFAQVKIGHKKHASTGCRATVDACFHLSLCVRCLGKKKPTVTSSRRRTTNIFDCGQSYMNSIANSSTKRKHNSAKCNSSLALTSGAKVRKKKHAPPPPPAPVLTIGRNISLELTLSAYEITPNAATVAKIGGNHE
jgi:hypothetical protein